MRWQGNAINMNSVLRVSYGDGTIDVRMDDWMYLQPDGRWLNRTAMRKFGLTLGEITLVFEKL